MSSEILKSHKILGTCYICNDSVKWFTGDDPADREALTDISLTGLKLVLGNIKVVRRSVFQTSDRDDIYTVFAAYGIFRRTREHHKERRSLGF